MDKPKADLVLSGATIHTLGAAGSSATAIAVGGDRILAVGADDEMERLAAPGARRLRLRGATVLPGLIDSHLHITHVGHVLGMAYLYDAWSVAEIVERLKKQAAKVPGPVLGRGGCFHETSLAEGRLPTAADLDRVATDRMVMITDVNKTIVNSFALRQIDSTDVPPGGEVPLGSSGKPLGIFLYAAKAMTPFGLFGAPVGVPGISTEQALTGGLQNAARFGLTGVVDAMGDRETMPAMRALARSGGLPIRVSTMPHLPSISLRELDDMGVGFGLQEGRLTFGPIKLIFDLLVMHKTALLYEPYVGQPGNRGKSSVPPEVLQRQIDASFAASWPVGIHTTGDRGIDITAAAIEKAVQRAGRAPARCHLIHVYFPTEQALALAKRQGLAIAAQPPFIRTWGETVRASVGEERASRFTPLRTLLDHGLEVGGGSDSNITWHDPWLGIYAAVTRKTEAGRVLGEAQKITVAEALRCYTLGSAAVLEQETLRGSIEPGKLADLAVIDRDILKVDVAQIPGTRVLYTIVGGQTVYQAGT